MYKVSIIVPVYNVEKYLNECIESLINQTYKNLEIILINDGSTDSSGIVCERYARDDNRIRVLHKGNGGAASAKNLGLDSMTGDYFTFVDSDDVIESTRIETMVNAMISHEVDIVETDFTLKFIDHTETVADIKEQKFSSEEYLQNYLNYWHCSLFWNKLFKSNLTKGLRFRKERRCIDDEFYTYKVCSNANNIMHINNCGYYYRQRKSSAVSNEKNKKQITKDSLDILVERYVWIIKKYPDISYDYYFHDINILFFFASDFLFDDESITLFKKVRKFYLIEGLRYKSIKIALILLKLMLISRNDLLQIKKTNSVNTTNYFE